MFHEILLRIASGHLVHHIGQHYRNINIDNINMILPVKVGIFIFGIFIDIYNGDVEREDGKIDRAIES
ncbi:hypothetical protein DAPPUDRAFT_323062 [Daphnia pulex]|uniref:Uncharacterized protein n=1 Tax=Daphnia pulex TaxID=6669 RepID=E9GXT8_DAPPU|nr:hypothetical protein DAPPUDRAFT_323062 [Daphnia pulex]|eukprot:EFX75720.1 hypothetical protein DAPPUDRAFT_323062 [Daphnia pulex]